jgi:hypothetical protein
MLSPKSFPMPVLPIGWNGETKSRMYLSANINSTNAAPDAPDRLPRWTHAGDSVTLRAEVIAAGDYDVEIHCVSAQQGAEIEVAFAGQTLRFSGFKGAGESFINIGRMSLPTTGPQDLTVKLLRPSADGSPAFNKPFWIAFSGG